MRAEGLRRRSSACARRRARATLLGLVFLAATAAAVRGGDAPEPLASDAVAGIYAPDLAASQRLAVDLWARSQGRPVESLTEPELERVRTEVRRSLRQVDLLLFLDADGAYELTFNPRLEGRVPDDPAQLRTGRWSIEAASVVLVERARPDATPLPPSRFQAAWSEGVLTVMSLRGGPPQPYRRLAGGLAGAWRMDPELSVDQTLDARKPALQLNPERWLRERSALLPRLRQRWPSAELDLDPDGTARLRLAHAVAPDAPAVLTPSRGTWRRDGRRLLVRILFVHGAALTAPTDGPAFRVENVGADPATIVLAASADEEFEHWLRRVPTGG